MWQSTLWDFLKSVPRFKPLLNKSLTWTTDDDNSRGFANDTTGDNKLTAKEKGEILDSILLKLIQYMCVKNSFDPSGTGAETYNDFYWRLRDNKIASLKTKDSGVTFNGKALDEDETITPSMENQVVVDWLEGIAGIKLVKYIGQEYAKELEKTSIFDLQETIGQQDVMRSIIDRIETHEVAKMNKAQAGAFNRNNSNRQRRAITINQSTIK